MNNYGKNLSGMLLKKLCVIINFSYLEFIEFIEENYSSDMVEEIIDASELPSGGSYTSVGTMITGRFFSWSQCCVTGGARKTSS